MTWHSPEELPPDPLRPLLGESNDLAVAQAFATYYRDRLAWSEERGIWRTNEGTCWVVDKGRAIHALAAEFTNQLRITSMGMDDADHLRWRTVATKLKILKNRVAMITDGKTFLQVPESEYDVDPHQLNTHVTLDLRTGLPSEAQGRFTKVTGAAWDPDAVSPAWDEFLGMIFPDTELRAYAQRCFGAGLSGVPGQRLMFACYGEPGTGKTTLANVIEATMGSYATVLRHDALASRQHASNAGHTSELMGLVQARMCFVHEIPKGMRLNASMVKGIVGGDTFSLSEKGLPHFTTKFSVKLFLVSNFPVVLDATDAAAWERYHLIPFNTPIPESARRTFAVTELGQDPGVRAACLRWLMGGWMAYSAGGLAVPAWIAELSKRQRDANSALDEWAAEYLIRGADLELDFDAARQSYNEWAAIVRQPRLSPRDFSSELRALGVQSARSKKSRRWLGASLAPRGEAL